MRDRNQLLRCVPPPSAREEMLLNCLPKVKRMLGWLKPRLRLAGLGKHLRKSLPSKGTDAPGMGRGGGSTAKLGSPEEVMLKPISSGLLRWCPGRVTKEPS